MALRNKTSTTTVSENRAVYSCSRLGRDTAAYFAALSGKAAAEESHLGAALAHATDELHFDERPDA